MKALGGCVGCLVVAAGLLAGPQAGAMTVAGPKAAVNTAEVRETLVNGVVTSIDAKQGILVAGARTYRFDPAAVSFVDQRSSPRAGGLASVQAGTKVTLSIAEQDGTELLVQIVAHD